MDFIKSRNSNSTSSNHSNSSSKSHGSSNNGGAAYNLEYCTSSSSVSPFCPTISCPSSTAKTVVSVAIDEVINSSSNSSIASRSPSSLSFKCSSQNAAKRKRKRSSFSSHEKDPEIGFEQPSAKRQQMHTIYQSDVGSVSSSVYPSPIDALVHDIDTQSHSDCISTASDYDVASDDIPDSPHSLQQEDDFDQINEEDISGTISSPRSTCSTHSSKQSRRCVAATNTLSQTPENGERTPGHVHIRAAVTCSPKMSKPAMKSVDDYVSVHYDCMTPAAEPELPRQCPLPALSWANAQDVWHFMCKKDEETAGLRDATMLEQHPGLQPRMRAILLDWLIEVCEVYKLHRETYYLAVDYLDRYLSAQKFVQKTHLQLIGITCLFVAAKVEEIYPPKIGEFAYVTDGACLESEILQHEILLLQALEWNITPVTPMGWLGVYMQLNVNNRTPSSLNGPSSSADPKKAGEQLSTIEVDEAFIYPQFSGMEFVQTAQLLDLCSLDVSIGNYPYSVLAAAAISHTFNRETALRCSGLDWQAISECAHWMEPFFKVICEEAEHLYLLEQNDQISSKCGLGHICPNIVTDESHIIQTHTISLTMFDRACLLQDQLSSLGLKVKPEASPATGLICPEGMLTPPASSRKPLDGIDEEDDDIAGEVDDEATDVDNGDDVDADPHEHVVVVVLSNLQ